MKRENAASAPRALVLPVLILALRWSGVAGRKVRSKQLTKAPSGDESCLLLKYFDPHSELAWVAQLVANRLKVGKRREESPQSKALAHYWPHEARHPTAGVKPTSAPKLCQATALQSASRSAYRAGCRVHVNSRPCLNGAWLWAPTQRPFPDGNTEGGLRCAFGGLAYNFGVGKRAPVASSASFTASMSSLNLMGLVR